MTSVWLGLGWFLYLQEHLIRISPDFASFEQGGYSAFANFITYTFGSMLGGLLVSAMEFFWFEGKFRGKSLGYVILIKTALIIFGYLIITTALSFAYNQILYEQLNPFDKRVLQNVAEYFFSSYYFANTMMWFFLIALTVVFIEITTVFGPGVLFRFIAGKYRIPRTEERIFMFVDLVGSTSIAEQLGAKQFFRFVQDFVWDVTQVINQYRGEIYKYVGDEIIITWPKARASQNVDALHCFFEMQNRIRMLSESYQKKFQRVPEFRAGLHLGPAMVGELGIIKKEIAYSGDTLNTTARIQAQCKNHRVDIAISEALNKNVELTHSGLAVKSLGEVELSGKIEKMNLFTVGYDV